MSRLFTRILYYLKLAVKKPYLISSFIFKKHLGVILLVPITKDEEFNKLDLDINIVRSTNAEEIYKFYKRMNRDSVNLETIKIWLAKKFDCFMVYSSDGLAIGGMWIFKDKFNLNNTSGRTLSSSNTIILDDETVYGAYVIIDEKCRGKGINQMLLRYVVDFYSQKSDYKKLLLITGASNGAYIRTTMKNNAKLIGITKVNNICGFKNRKELFLDKKEKVWNN